MEAPAGTLVRAFTAECLRLAPDPASPDARTITGRLVPYGEATDVTDEVDGALSRYREAFAVGAFTRQLDDGSPDRGGVARRVGFVDEHHGGLGKLGYAMTLEDKPDGLYGQLRVLPHAVRNVETMLADGVDGLSVGFVPLRTSRQADGTELRTRAHLVHVALVAVGSYPSAKVLAMRVKEDDMAEDVEAHKDAETFRSELELWVAQDQERRERLHALLNPVA